VEREDRCVAKEPAGLVIAVFQRSRVILPKVEIVRVQLVVACLAVLGSFNNAQAITGYELQTMNSSWRGGYVAGVLDAWAETASLELKEDKSDSTLVKAFSCISVKKISYRQIAAEVEKYMKEHPEEWHKDASALVYFSLLSVCRDNQ
jgi:hypothetical protein